jgi:DNA-binding LacI/PurR family transcriptional regulator
MADSLTAVIAQKIRQDFIDGRRLPIGARLPSVRDLTRMYGVSISTIANALSLLEREGVVQKRHGSGCYVTDPADRATDGVSRPKLLGCVMRNAAAESVVRITAGIQHVAHKHGFHLLTASTDDDYDGEREQLSRMRDAGCQAIVLLPAIRTQGQLLKDYLTTEFREVPIVLVDIAYAEQQRSSVIFDNYRAGYAITEHLVGQGHRRIAFLDLNLPDGGLMHRSTRDRYLGYRDALAAAGLPYIPEDHWTLFHRFPSQWNSEEITSELLPFLTGWRRQPEDRPTAVIALEDLTAMHMLSLARELHIAVPDQLTVVGFDNLSVAQTFSPSFTTTAADFARAGEIATEMALREMLNPSVPHEVYVLPVPILHRVSMLQRAETGAMQPALS